MRWADLVLAYIRVVIWPVVLVTLLYIFRSQVRTFLSQLAERIKDLRSFKGFGAEIDFGQIVLEAKQAATTSAEELSSDKDSGSIIIVPDANVYASMVSPQTTVVAAWQQLETTVALIQGNMGLDNLPPEAGVVTQTAAICSELIESGTLSDASANAILTAVTQLAYLRSSVERRIVTKLEAYEFADTTSTVSGNLMRAHTVWSKRDTSHSPDG
jgi:hypothetical protein